MFYSLGQHVQPYQILDRYVQPWRDWQASTLQRDTFLHDQGAAQGAYLNAYSLSGPGAVSPAFQRWLQSQVDDYYQRYKGWQVTAPGQQQAGWDEYMNQQNPYQDYMNTNPYADAAVRAARPTRFILRR